MAAQQLNIFDVLRGLADPNSPTYKATVKIITSIPKDVPPPDDGYIPPSFTDIINAASQLSSEVNIPNPPPKPVSWLKRNWPWLVVSGILVGIIIYLVVQNRKKKKQEEEHARKDAERLPKINYPWPSEASSGPVVEEQPTKSSLVEMYFNDLESEKAATSNETPPTEPTSNSEAKK